MPSVSQVEDKIAEVEGFCVFFVLADGSWPESRQIGDYPYVRAASGKWTVAKWIDTRLTFLPLEFSVVVYDWERNIVDDNILLSTLRATWDRFKEREESSDDDYWTEEELQTKTRKELKQIAEENDIQVKPGATKQQFVDAILGEPEEDEEENDEADALGGQPLTGAVTATSRGRPREGTPHLPLLPPPRGTARLMSSPWRRGFGMRRARFGDRSMPLNSRTISSP